MAHDNLQNSCSTSGTMLPISKEQIKLAFLNGGLSAFRDRDLVVIVNNGVNFKLHKEQFMSRSPVLRDKVLLAENAYSGSGDLTVNLPIEACTFSTLIQMMYIGDVKHPEVVINGPKHALSVLEAVVGLHMIGDWNDVAEVITPHISKETALKTLLIANQLFEDWPGFVPLKDAAYHLILANGQEFLESDGVFALGPRVLCEILCDDALKVDSELSVYQAIIRWINYHTKSLTIYQNLYTVFNKCIRFELMSKTELQYVETNQLIQDLEYLRNNYRYFLDQNHPMHLKPRPRLCSQSSEKTTSQSNGNEEQQGNTSQDPACFSVSNPVTVTPFTAPDSNATSFQDDEGFAGKDVPHSSEHSSSLKSILRKSSESSNTPTKKRRVTFASGTKNNQKVDDSNSNSELFTVAVKVGDRQFPSFDHVFQKYSDLPNPALVDSFEMKNVTVLNPFSTSVLPICRDVRIDTNINLINGEGNEKQELLAFISTFNPFRYIAPFKRNEDVDLKSIWEMEQNVLLCVNGIKFMEILHKENGPIRTDKVVLNYIKDTMQICANHTLKPHELCLSNCPWSFTDLQKSFFGCLKTLILYKCWGEFSIEDIISNVSTLENLYYWNFQVEETSSSSCLDMSVLRNHKKLKTLGLCNVELSKTKKRISQACNLEALILDNCKLYAEDLDTTNTTLNSISKLCGNLETLCVINDENQQNSRDHLLSTFPELALKMNRLCKLEVLSTRLSIAEKHPETPLLNKVLNTNSASSSSGVMDEKIVYFSIERESLVNPDNWKCVETYTETLLPKEFVEDKRYERFLLNTFYKDSTAFSKHFLGKSDNFPKKIYWA